MRNSTQKWWIESILRHHKNLSFDGLWIVSVKFKIYFITPRLSVNFTHFLNNIFKSLEIKLKDKNDKILTD